MTPTPKWRIPHTIVWEMQDGKPTKLKSDDGFFLVNPESTIMDPVGFINKFFANFKVIHRTITPAFPAPKPVSADSPPVVSHTKKAPAKTIPVPLSERLALISNITVSRKIVTCIFEKFQGHQFYRSEVIALMMKIYPDISKATAKNRASAYLKYLEESKKLEVVAIRAHKKIYRLNMMRVTFDSEEARLRGIEERKALQGVMS